jgi:uncharacterized protein (DUF2384 family)
MAWKPTSEPEKSGKPEKKPASDNATSKRLEALRLRPKHVQWVVKRGSSATVKVRKSDSEQNVAEYAKVLSHAVETFGSRVNANAWLNKPNRVFHNQSPLQILTQDPVSVEEELVRIDHGMFV